MPTTARRPRSPVPAALRGLGVLLVLLGVVAMHQLSGGTHTATTTTTTAHATAHAHAAAPADAAAARAVLGADGRATSGMVSMPGSPVVDAQATVRSMAQHGAMPLCLAVLTGLALLALPAATRVARSTSTGTPAATRHDTSPSGRGPPRSLLAQLCVLRI